jgi:copper chaperone CopZ
MQTIQLNISGMTCGACVGHVTQGLQSVSGVQSVVVDLASNTATVSGEVLDLSQLVEAVNEEGYGASEVSDASSSESAGKTQVETQAETIPLAAQGCSCCASEAQKA